MHFHLLINNDLHASVLSVFVITPNISKHDIVNFVDNLLRTVCIIEWPSWRLSSTRWIFLILTRWINGNVVHITGHLFWLCCPSYCLWFLIFIWTEFTNWWKFDYLYKDKMAIYFSISHSTTLVPFSLYRNYSYEIISGHMTI